MEEEFEFNKEYAANIKKDVENGNYFKDSYNYYCIAYLYQITDRTFYIFMSIISLIILYFAYKIIIGMFPLKEEIYIAIKENDLTKYQTSIVDLTKFKEARSVDEMILQYLTMNYVKERETHNYRSGNINDINNKLVKIKNTSSGDVYNEFKQFMSRENTNGPYYYFGKSITTRINITDVKFIRLNENGVFNKIKNFFSFKVLLPIQTEIYYDLITDNGEKQIIQKRKALLTYKYTTFIYNKIKNEYSPVKFYITSYKNFAIN